MEKHDDRNGAAPKGTPSLKDNRIVAEIDLFIGVRKARLTVVVPNSHCNLLLMRNTTAEWILDRKGLLKDLGQKIGFDIARTFEELLTMDDPK